MGEEASFSFHSLPQNMPPATSSRLITRNGGGGSQSSTRGLLLLLLAVVVACTPAEAFCPGMHSARTTTTTFLAMTAPKGPMDDDISRLQVKARLLLEKSKAKLASKEDDEDSEEIEVKCTMFEGGEAEEWIQWRMQMDELIRDMPLDDVAKKIKVAKALLKGQAREHLTAILP